jgi:hypothetical protein
MSQCPKTVDLEIVASPGIDAGQWSPKTEFRHLDKKLTVQKTTT